MVRDIWSRILILPPSLSTSFTPQAPGPYPMLSRLLRLSPLLWVPEMSFQTLISMCPAPPDLSQLFSPLESIFHLVLLGPLFTFSLSLCTSSASTCSQILLIPCSVSICRIDTCNYGDTGLECSNSKIPILNSPPPASQLWSWAAGCLTDDSAPHWKGLVLCFPFLKKGASVWPMPASHA